MMDYRALCATINPDRHDVSVVFTNPKPALIEWLTEFRKRAPPTESDPCDPEHYVVLMVPKADRFKFPGAFDEFMQKLKPKLLLVQLERFGVTPEDFDHPITSETFDQYIEFFLRDAALLMSDLKSLGW